MRYFLTGLMMLGLLLQISVAATEIYRSQDALGHAYFSDKPGRNAVKVEVRPQPYRYRFQIKYVYDGDTIVLRNGQRVRLLGINTPEISSHFRQGETGGQAAKKWLQDKLKAGVVLLEYGTPDRDKYNRILAHLFLPDGQHLNLALLQQGLAVLSIIPPNLRYAKAFIQAERMAEQQQRGLWAQPDYQPLSLAELLHNRQRKGWMRLHASVKKFTQSRKYVRLILNDKVDVRIPRGNLRYFPDLSAYIGKKLEIRGWPSRKKGHISILVRHPSALRPVTGAVLPVSDDNSLPRRKE